jgi:spore coat protein U-like protein
MRLAHHCRLATVVPLSRMLTRLRQRPVAAGVGVLALLALALPPIAVVASTATTTFAVSVTVQATCLITASSLSFGTYTGVVTVATSTLSITCTNTTPYNVGLDPGLAPGATVTSRQMSSGGILMPYAVFSDMARTINWGQTVGVDTVTGTGSGIAQVLTVYGQIPAGQFVNPGTYTDTITATVTY